MSTAPADSSPRGLVVFAVPDFEPAVGGTTRQVGLQARALAGRGHDVVVVTRRREGSWPRRERLAGLEVHRVGLPGRGRLREALALIALGGWLRRRRRRIGPVATVMWPDAQVAAFAAGVLSRTVTVWAIRGEAEAALAEGASAARRAVLRLRRSLLRRTPHVVLTASMAEELVATGAGTSIVIPVPVDCRHFRPPSLDERADARRALGIDPASFVVVYVGHLEARKAVDKLVEAVRLLLEAVPGARLLLVGGGRSTREDTEVELRGLVGELGLEPVVAFCGVRPDPRPYLWAADALVLPSVREGMPNSLLEGMACGLPCVAPASAGGDEVLEAETGIVPRSNEPGELAAALERLATDPRLREELGRAAHARVQRYDIGTVAEAYDRLFAGLVPGGAS